jgi:hypothetical protein
MSNRRWVSVARYHLVDRVIYVGLPWGTLAFVFMVNLVIFAAVPAGANHDTGALASIYIFSFIYGLLSVVRSLPFGLALGLSRRSYYFGTAFLAVTLAAVYGLALALLQIVERLTSGWGVSMHFFRVPWILGGPWYLTWLTSFVVLALTFVYGMWFGLVYRRWSLIGVVTFIAAQMVGMLAAVLVVTWVRAWPNIGHFFTDLSAAGLTGVLAAVALALFAGGSATMRRIAV